jgi:hypothetical protein
MILETTDIVQGRPPPAETATFQNFEFPKVQGTNVALDDFMQINSGVGIYGRHRSN